MYGNTGECWVMIKELELNGLMINEAGTEFKIDEYYSVPHGYTAITYEGCLIYMPDAIFEECFVKWDVYKQYYQLETIILNANGTLVE
ncbi:MAG: hypothetical protein ACRC3H_21450 [Lachnospiraceae bacterium]